MLNRTDWKIKATIIETQSIIFIPKKNIKKISWSNSEGSKKYIVILIRYPKAFDKKYVCIPNKKIPTIVLNRPKYLAPLKPNEDLNRTTKGKPNFWDGLPIKFEKK